MEGLLEYYSQHEFCKKNNLLIIKDTGVSTSTVSTSTVSTSTIFIAIGIKSVLMEFSRIRYVVKFVLVEIAM